MILQNTDLITVFHFLHKMLYGNLKQICERGKDKMKNSKIAFVGGDKRMFFCAEALYDMGYESALFGFDKISGHANSTRCASLQDCVINSSAIILPLPVSRDGKTVNSLGRSEIMLNDVFNIASGIPIFAGSVSPEVTDIAQSFGHTVYDYYESESFIYKNALATAEGAVFLAMQHSDKTLFGSHVLITGFGRIAKYTARLFDSFGADICICARKEKDRAYADTLGYSAVGFDDLSTEIKNYDIVINTVPANVFTEAILSNMQSNKIYIELASAPYGVSKSLADKYNIEICDGRGLPSRYSPRSAGKYIADEVSRELERLGVV